MGARTPIFRRDGWRLQQCTDNSSRDNSRFEEGLFLFGKVTRAAFLVILGELRFLSEINWIPVS